MDSIQAGTSLSVFHSLTKILQARLATQDETLLTSLFPEGTPGARHAREVFTGSGWEEMVRILNDALFTHVLPEQPTVVSRKEE
jgi:hypothetical protein